MQQDTFIKMQDSMNSGIALFGAGINVRWVLDYLLKKGYSVICLIDNNPKLQGLKVAGIPVISLDDYREKYSNLGILITAKHAVREIMNDLHDIDNVMPFDAWFYMTRKPEYDELRGLLVDDKSCETLDGIIQTMLTGNEDYSANIAVDNQYFCVPGFFNTIKDVFVDIGTCTGDSVENFLHAMTGLFSKIYAFEPGKRQFQAANIRFRRLVAEWGLDSDCITLENMGIGKIDDVVRLCDTEVKDSSNNIQFVSLDSYFKDKKVTFLKADIEGDEMNMLVGGEHVIRAQRPKIAICVYHRPDDLINIIKILHKYVPEYRFYLRHHSSLSVETVLYCRL